MKYYKKKSRKYTKYIPYRYSVVLSDIKNKKKVRHVFPIFNQARRGKRGEATAPKDESRKRAVVRPKGIKRSRPVAQKTPTTPSGDKKEKKVLINKNNNLYEGTKYAGLITGAYKIAKYANTARQYYNMALGKRPRDEEILAARGISPDVLEQLKWYRMADEL